MKKKRSINLRVRGLLTGSLITALLVALPIAVWLDLTNLGEAALRRQATDLNSVITSVRGYYGANVVGRVLSSPGTTRVVHNYETIPGAIPIPATLSLELGKVINEQQQNILYRFVSDYPFQNRTPHQLDEFERSALEALRRNPEQKTVVETSHTLFNDSVRLVAPVIMGQACVSCHNIHPESPKRDWKVGDVRGIQEVSITLPIAANILSFKYLMAYFAFVAISGAAFMGMQRRQATQIRGMNRDLESANDFLASLSMKISRYISPQIYKSIFSGQKDVIIHTERKKLTIFFSDIQNFTATTERLQPEMITQLLNEYFTEMSAIALKHGGTIDKFIGDAMLIFFGDPETKGERLDAQACIRMACEMQRRLVELSAKWRTEGIEHPFRARMGINSGYCNVGNFGSADRMDYTIIGAEANLAARLQSVAEPGHIVISYETFALASDLIVAHPLPAITMKGISREVIPYSVDSMREVSAEQGEILIERMKGLDFYLDPAIIESKDTEKIRSLLSDALAALDRRQASGSV